mmetsp:Transcript_1141/g.1922  ORF Transcript_1141/g.1922 Transcript_1141/m.1922 type:complete len:183 (+) Transcript_1141:104-652(+)|eukprot:CAMPEP_0169114582 /NCGR_PEP_ID=MMETSP1015-20121227/28839_1 /TAXON_ID=342587 /ORGANISM="Karlodinium micrum, Strain CCMP2283" /LENGTH=182 /DNA_ID=CAMNT_0009176883 /DNA_START=104 /DNA_END=652 /DNA_ORIENTATION=+
MKVHIQTWNSQKHRWDNVQVASEKNETVAQLKERIKTKLGISIERQVLQFAGEHLNDDRKLGSYNIGNGGQVLLQDFAEHCPASWAAHHCRSLSFGIARGEQAEAFRHCDMGAGETGPIPVKIASNSPPPSPRPPPTRRLMEPEIHPLSRDVLEDIVPTLCHHFPDVGVKDLNQIYGSPWDE